ncbi:MAG: hypothetical protein UZ05_CHB002001611 [Chlorobi bacterium OLB5]|nr:MAG: hypothetical protein UZ05_CHB002001611 [Chlorobi bacterium OLB5]
MHNIILISIMIVSFVCGSADKNSIDTKQKTDKNIINDSPKTNLELNDNQTVIPASAKMEFAFGRNYKTYEPSQADIELAEKLLMECFNKEVSGTYNPFFGRKLDQYNRQFVPAEMEGGDKLIWINCFIYADVDPVKKWKTDILYVADGGNAFFNLKVNLTRGTYYGLMVNGMP